jgi:hypothetical protein
MKYFSKKQTVIFWLFVIAIGLMSGLDATACDANSGKIIVMTQVMLDLI